MCARNVLASFRPRVFSRFIIIIRSFVIGSIPDLDVDPRPGCASLATLEEFEERTVTTVEVVEWVRWVAGKCHGRN